VRSRILIAIVLILTTAGFTRDPSAGSGQASPEASDADLSDRVSRLEARLEEEQRDDAILRGRAIYAKACATCHGRDGKGDGPGARELDPWPRDLTAGKYRIRSTLSGEPPRREDIEGAVGRGMPGTLMPAFGEVLTEPEIADVVTFMLDLGPRSLTHHQPEALSIPEFPAPDATSLADGRAVYLILGCWKCHGLEGNGHGPSTKDLRSDEGQRARPRDFRYDPFKGGRSPETVARTALSGLIGTPMPSHAEIMVIPLEAIDIYTESLPTEVRPELDEFRVKAPPATELAGLDDDAWLKLRDENLVSLVHYVLSLDRREGFAHRLFREQPELEGREP